MMDTKKIAVVLEFSIRGYLFGIGEATPKELKEDLKELFPKPVSDLIDIQFDKILERKLKEIGWNHLEEIDWKH